MEKQVQILILTNNLVLISQIDEIFSDIGGPDCKLTNPFLIENGEITSSWLSDYTISNEVLISSDKILTIIDPREKYLEKYLEITS